VASTVLVLPTPGTSVSALTPEFGGVQFPLVNHCTFTVPVGAGWPAGPATVTTSCTVEPAATAVTAPPPALLWISVVVVVGSGSTSVAAPAPVNASPVLHGLPTTGLSQTCL